MSDMFKMAKGNTFCSATQIFHGIHYHKMFLKPKKVRCVSEIAIGTLDRARKEIIASQAPRHKTVLTDVGQKTNLLLMGSSARSLNIPTVTLANIREKLLI